MYLMITFYWMTHLRYHRQNNSVKHTEFFRNVFLLTYVTELGYILSPCMQAAYRLIAVYWIPVPYVLDNTPPLYPHYFVPKVGRGLILEYAVSLDYTPPQPFLLHTVQV